MSSSQRKLIASIVLLAFLGLWIWGAASIGSMLATAPKWMSLVFFIVAGIGWVFPLKPLFGWMNSGPDANQNDDAF